MTHSHLWHDSFVRVPWLTHMWHVRETYVSHSYVCHDWFISVTFRGATMTHSHTWHDSFMCVIHVWHDSFMCVIWLLHTCAMTPSRVWYDSFIRVSWLIHTSPMTFFDHISEFIYVCQDSLKCVPWLTHRCSMTHSHVCNDSLTCVPMTRFHHRTSSSCQGMRAGRYEFLKVNSKVIFYNVASWFFRISIVGAWGLGGTNSQESALTFFSITNLVASWLFRISCLEAWGLGGNSCSKGSSKEVLFITNLDAHWLLRISVFGA